MSTAKLNEALYVMKNKVRKGLGLTHNSEAAGALTPITESPKVSIKGKFGALLFSKTAKDKKQIFMSTQRRFKGNYLYNTNNIENVFASQPLEPNETPGPGTYVNQDFKSIASSSSKKESMSRTGYGNGFVSK